MSLPARHFHAAPLLAWGTLLFPLALLASACQEEGTVPMAGDMTGPSCDTEIEGLEQNLSREGIRTTYLAAEQACLWERSDTIVVEAFRLTMFDATTGVETALVTGDRGVLNLVTQEMRANGNAVLFITEQDRRIESSEIFYQPEQNRMYSDSTTLMYVEGRVIEGAGFDSDLAFESPSIRRMRTRAVEGAAPGPPEGEEEGDGAIGAEPAEVSEEEVPPPPAEEPADTASGPLPGTEGR